MFIKAKHRGIFKSKNENQEKEFDIGELKFTNLKTNKYLDMYKEIVEACFEYDHFYFSARVVDKNKKENGKKNRYLVITNQIIKISY
ncbi:hypothetical protein O6B94_08955 [Campylobacter ureolyticus]|nr:hypothetical protein [Campylobacter ureolyticus]